MMNLGLLWYDSDPQRGLEEKVGRAAQRYRQKFGRAPNTCYVNPGAVAGLPMSDGAACRVQCSEGMIQVFAMPNVLRHHFWLAESEMPSPAKSAR